MLFDKNMTLDIQNITMHFPDESEGDIRETATGGVIRDGLWSANYLLDEFDWDYWDSTQTKMSRAFNCESEASAVSTNWSFNEELISRYFPSLTGQSNPRDKDIELENVDPDEFNKILDT